MKYEIKRGYNGSPEMTGMSWNQEETRFIAYESSDDAAYWVKYELHAPIETTFIMAPACVYDGNHFNIVMRNYPPVFTEEEMREDLETTMVQVPHLKPQGDSRMEVTTGDFAAPCVCILDKAAEEAFMLFFNQGAHGLNHGVTLEQSGDKLSITLRAPVKRELVYRWQVDDMLSLIENPGDDEPLKIDAGEETVITHKVFTFPCKDIPQLYREFFEKRQVLFHAESHANLPFSAFWDFAQEQINEEYFIEKEGYYSLVEGNVLPDGYLQVGWVGGGMDSLTFLNDGNELSKERAIKTLLFITKLQSETGWYYGIYRDGEIKCDSFRAQKNKWVLVRRQGDMLYFMCKQIRLLKEKHMSIPDVFYTSAKKAADALVNLWNRCGQLGQFVCADTGEIMVGGSASGAMAPAALCAYAELSGEQKYLECAREIARFFYKTAILRGVTTGGPGEAMQAPDSESVAALMESYTVLYETDGTEEWLKYACDAVHQLSTWVVPYDYQFPKESRFGKMNVHTAGSVWANLQNKHSAPGLATMSAVSLLKLYRATGDEGYLELMRQISHFIPQVVSYPGHIIYTIEDGPLHGAPIPNGLTCERVNMSDWEGKMHVGDNIFGPSTWPKAVLMLTYTEVPGIYVVPSRGIVCTSDHVNAWLEDGKLKINNPTELPARVKILVDTEDSLKEKLGHYWLDKFKQVAVASKETVEVLI